LFDFFLVHILAFLHKSSIPGKPFERDRIKTE
jgi:hypothetical protein